MAALELWYTGTTAEHMMSWRVSPKQLKHETRRQTGWFCKIKLGESTWHFWQRRLGSCSCLQKWHTVTLFVWLKKEKLHEGSAGERHPRDTWSSVSIDPALPSQGKTEDQSCVTRSMGAYRETKENILAYAHDGGTDRVWANTTWACLPFFLWRGTSTAGITAWVVVWCRLQMSQGSRIFCFLYGLITWWEKDESKCVLALFCRAAAVWLLGEPRELMMGAAGRKLKELGLYV